MSGVWNPLIVALVSTIATGLQFASTLLCDFVVVQAKDGEILAITDESEQVAVTSTTIGLNCQGDFYNLDNDPMWRVGNLFSLASLGVGIMTFLVSWTSVVVSPTMFLWKGIAIIASLSALLQVPAFVIFESYPCADFSTQQECKLSDASYFLIISTVFWMGLTAATQFLDPPSWRQQLHLWRIPKNQTSEDSSHFVDEEERRQEQENQFEDVDLEDGGSQDPIFAAGQEKSDALLESKERLPILGRMKHLLWVDRAVDRRSSRASTCSQDSQRVVQKYSFSVPKSVTDAANQMGERTESGTSPSKSTMSNKNKPILTTNDEINLTWNRSPKRHGSGVNRKEKRLQKNVPKSPVQADQLSADESVLDTITGEESILDASISDGDPNNNPSVEMDSLPRLKLSRKEISDAAINGTPIYETLINEDRVNQKESPTHATPPTVVPTLSFQQEKKSEPDGLVADETIKPTPLQSQNVLETEQEADLVQKEQSEGTPRGMFAVPQRRLPGYHRMVEDDSVSPSREQPPMAEVSFDADVNVFHEPKNVEEEYLLSDWNELFAIDRIAPPTSKDEFGAGDNFQVDRQGPPSTTSEEESENERYYASSEYEEPEPTSAAREHLERKNDNEENEVESSVEEEEEEPEENNSRKVLHPPRVRRRHAPGGSVGSSRSLLSYTIEEETEEDLRNSSAGSDQEPNREPPRCEERERKLTRSRSSPNLVSRNVPAAESLDCTNTGEESTMFSALTCPTDEMESTITGPRPFHSQPVDDESAVQTALSGMESQVTGPRPLERDKTNESTENDNNSESILTGPQPLLKKRSKSLELLPEISVDADVWKPDRYRLASIHHSPSYVSSSEDSSGCEEAKFSPRNKARRSRIQRIQSERTHSASEDEYNITSSDNSNDRYIAALRRKRLSSERLSLSTSRPRPQIVSPNCSTGDVSVTSDSDMDVEPADTMESFLLDSVDVSLAKLARDTDDEYGEDEDSI